MPLAIFPSPWRPPILPLLACLGILGILLPIPERCLAMSSLGEIHVLSRVFPSQKRVTLLDLVDRGTIPEDWQRAMSSVDIGEAPSVGQPKYIDPKNLKPFLNQFVESQGTAASRVSLYVPEMIVVERKTSGVSQERLEEIFLKFVQEHVPWDREEITVQGITCSGLPPIPAGEMTYEVIASPREKFVGNVAVTVHFFVDGERAGTARVSGRIDLYRDVVHLNRPLKKNEIVGEADLEIHRIPVGESSDRYITRPEQVINKRLIRSVEAHEPLQEKDLDNALVLKRGDMVTIVYDDSGLKLTAKGKAREDGCLGEHIRIHNVSTNKVVICRVLDGQTVQATQ
ncbi:MAG: flagellar basal body P-ring formation protein FlgA [Deltaproteobacteria bacterium]|nr:flagellar basal body P-ring formation protein FlgA [Deltaproteobacteria bacterium]